MPGRIACCQKLAWGIGFSVVGAISLYGQIISSIKVCELNVVQLSTFCSGAQKYCCGFVLPQPSPLPTPLLGAPVFSVHSFGRPPRLPFTHAV